MTDILEHIADLRRREKRLWKIAIPLWFLGPILFGSAVNYCQGSDIISAHWQGAYYAAKVKGVNVYISRTDYFKAIPLEVAGFACGLTFVITCGYSEFLKWKIRKAEQWAHDNQIALLQPSK